MSRLKKMKKALFSILIVLMFSSTVCGQRTWLNSLKIRQSFEDDNSVQNPALFSLTFPKNKVSSYLADLALAYNLGSHDPTGTRMGSLVAELHRTNLSDEEVNNFQFGYKHVWIFKKPLAVVPKPGTIPDFNSFRLNSTLKYRQDKIEGSKGVAATFLIAYFQQGDDYHTWWSSTKFSRSQRFHFVLTPQLGIEMQENFRADSTKVDGFLGRGIASLSAGFGGARPDPGDKIFPIGTWLLSISGTIRYDILGESYTDSRLHPLIKTNLDFYLLYKPIKVILGGSYTYGDNPIDGFREFKFKPQQFWIVALKVQK
jgi:hypothetical protein